MNGPVDLRVRQAAGKQEPVFSVKLPRAVIIAVKRRARDKGRTVRDTVLEALRASGIVTLQQDRTP